MNIEYTCIKKGNYIVANEPGPETNPDTSTEPDFDDYPVEIDYPDYDQDYGVMASVDFETDSNDFESIVREVREDIANDNFLCRVPYYMELLKVDRAEFDEFINYEFTHQEMEEMIESGDEPLWEMEVKVNEVKVFERLFSLYCQDKGFVIPAQTNHHLREYIDRLDKDYRYFPKKQLSLFVHDQET